jgi:PRC-barrel domain
LNGHETIRRVSRLSSAPAGVLPRRQGNHTMVKISFAASLLATTLLVSPAFAQTGTGSGTTAPMGAPVPTAVPLNNASFMTNDQAPGTMWRASKMVGVNIYGPAGQKVGDVSEVLLDHQGNVKAVVIGVGGFLGMG